MQNKQACPNCKKTFILKIETLPSKMDDKRKSYYFCPYCNYKINDICLAANEEVWTYKLDK